MTIEARRAEAEKTGATRIEDATRLIKLHPWTTVVVVVAAALYVLGTLRA